jgi:hypothetical protein
VRRGSVRVKGWGTTTPKGALSGSERTGCVYSSVSMAATDVAGEDERDVEEDEEGG